ncbi:hypothetical protein SASPL_145359 [Salvia splendens]|uniref:Uncharacterized protein n=1 Tax=Salvia splendens TaxID=180675 RepID=A0A8X8Z8A8_SALSN|nr:hypothetical protein SASPL_145359 [Salvia splendens]
MDFSTQMESTYSYSDDQQGGYSEECYSPDQGGSYYDPVCFDFSYDAQDHYTNENSEICAGMEEQPRSKWEEVLEICIIEVKENRKVTSQRLINLEEKHRPFGARIDESSRTRVEGYQECSVIQVVTDCVGEVEVTYHQTQDPLEYCVINSFTPTFDSSTCDANLCAMIAELEVLPERIPQKGNTF